MRNSLNYRILRLIISLVIMTTVIILLAVWYNTSKTVHKNIYGSLLAIRNTVSSDINDFAKQKQQQTIMFFENDVIHAPTDNDIPPNIQSSLSSLLSSVNAHAALWKNELTFSKNVVQKSAFSDQEITAINEYDTEEPYFFINNNKHLYMIIKYPEDNLNVSQTLTELAGQYSLFLIINIDHQWLQEISYSAGLHLSLLLEEDTTKNTKQNTVLSSLTKTPVTADNLTSGVVTENYLTLLNPAVILGWQPLHTIELPLPETIGKSASLYLSINAKRVSASFIELQTTIGSMALLAVLIAALFGLFLARRLSKPLLALVAYSEKIAKGDYSNQPDIVSYTSEFASLLKAYKNMQKNILSREEAIRIQSERDALTSLFNRKYMQKKIDSKFARRKQFQAITIILVNFRDINDAFGSDIGDGCLVELANRLTTLQGWAARLNSGKFLWLHNEQTSITDLEILKKNLSQPLEINGLTISINLTFGVLLCPQEANDSESVFRRLAILGARETIINNEIQQFSPATEEAHLRKLSIVSSLKEALENNKDELSLVFQPIQYLQPKERTIKAEALIRWNNPILGNVMPDEFIKIAEHSGLINKLTYWVIDNAMKFVAELQTKGLSIQLAVNLSTQDIQNPDFLSYVQQKQQFYKLKTHSISFELTESLLADKADKALTVLNKLRNSGFDIAIDDFGTGYSSLSYLAAFPANFIKIDRSFVTDLATNNTNNILCKRIVELAHDLNLQVVAEGIEDSESLQILTDLGCEWGQGYYLLRPASAPDFIAWLHANHPLPLQQS